tara:strand:+ start:7825 stop:8505 length:681 start_codon:yes stop_codon:yes gene_type:complete
MSAFDRAWALMKDFYFGQGGEQGKARMTRRGQNTSYDRQGSDDFLQGRGNLQNRMVGYGSGKNKTYSTQTQLKPMHERRAGNTRYTAGMNLSNVDSQVKEGLANEDPKAFREFVEGASGAGRVLAHEHGHGLINDEIEQGPYKQNINWQNKAHEIGAYTLENPGGPYADAASRIGAGTHPDMQPQTFADRPDMINRIPKPAYDSKSRNQDDIDHVQNWMQERGINR